MIDEASQRPLPVSETPSRRASKSDDIAVVGMACMFPQAQDLRTYWENIVNRVDAIEEVPAERWRAEDYYSENRFEPDRVYSKWGGFLGKLVFDPMKWHIPPASLLSTEPLQLLSLEVAARAMADAGYDQRDFPRERAGVIFACAGSHDLGTGYSFRTMMRHYLPLVKNLPDETREQIYTELEEQLPDWTEDSFPGFLLNVVAGRIARELNLNGPNYVVDAACAASLAALHAAIEQLRSGNSDLMLVGGADATNNPFCYMCFSKTHALSPHGRSRPFDEAGDGIGLGEGIGVIVLKRLADAERDGDKIYAVIKGIGASSDGKNRSLTAPHPPGQAKAVTRAYADAQVSPATISLVEAHGTGTVVGDSAELQTLTQVFSPHTTERQFAAVGSVKSMIGHTKTVAGLASLIKTVLAVKHGVLPPTIGVEKPSTRIDFENSPFYLNTEARPWLRAASDLPRRAGVSAFGFGGTNFHVVLEEYAGANQAVHGVDLSPRSAELFLWARSTRDELLKDLKELSAKLAETPRGSLPELAHALHLEEQARADRGRSCRLGIVATSFEELGQKIAKAIPLVAERDEVTDPSGIYYSEAEEVRPEQICFLYPGQGSQTVNMLRDLVLASPWAHDQFTRANELLAEFLPQPLSQYIYPMPVFSNEARHAQSDALRDTRVAQPALGVVELFATSLLERFGVRPGMVAGHSYGEHVALHAAGCLSQGDLLIVSAQRGAVCADAAALNAGGMVAVQADAATTEALLKELEIDASLANLNAPDQTIISGTNAGVEAAVERLVKRGIRAKRIPVSAAFHSPLLHTGAEAMAVHFGNISFAKPEMPVYSNTTGEAHSSDPESIRELLTHHFDQPVLFEKEIRQIHADGARVFIEVGPGKVLTDLVGRILKDQPITALAIDAPGRAGWTQLGHVFARLWALGVAVRMEPWLEGRGLGCKSVAEFFEQTQRENNPKPSDWIVGPTKAVPRTPLPPRRKGSGLHAKFGMKPTPVNEEKEKSVAPAPATANAIPLAAVAVPKPAPASEPIAAQAPPAPAGEIHRAATAAPTAMRPEPARPALSGAARPTPIIPASDFDRTTIPMTTPNPNTSLVPGVHGGLELFAQFQATARSVLEFQQSQQRLFERFLETQERVLYSCLQGAPVASLPLTLLSPPAPAPAPQAIAPQTIAEPSVGVAPARVAAAPSAHKPPVFIPANGAAGTVPKIVTPTAGPAVQPVAAPAPAPIPAATPVARATNGSAASAAPAPVAAAPAAPSSNGSADGPPPTEKFRTDLLEIVSERTGYPVDMLDETLPLEAGLGIDSIKTVEIFSNLKDYHAYFADEGQDEEERLTEFTSLKTLRDIIDSYDRRRTAHLASSSRGSNGHATPAPAKSTPASISPAAVERLSLTAVEAPVEINGSGRKVS